MDTAGLRQAYDVLLAEADAGGFGLPPAGQWSAEQVVAHVTANDDLLTEATEAVLAGSPWAYYDHDALHTAQLADLIRACGGLPGLLTRLRLTSRRLCDLIDRLTPDAATTDVETHLRDGDTILLDGLLPWSRTLDIHRRLHLPTHTAQLHALRPPP
jgi:hypothetical protein